MDDSQRISNIIKEIPLLSALSGSAIRALASESATREVRRRRVVYMPGDPGEDLFFSYGGRTKVSRVTPDGKELTLAYRDVGEPFGELCLIDGGPREEMAEAVDSVALLVIPRQAFLTAIADNYRVAWALASLQLERRQKLERKMEDIIFRDVNSNLAELLIQLSDPNSPHRGQEESGENPALENEGPAHIQMTHQEMANLIGSTRETVSLTLSQFKKQKLIRTDSRKVIVEDRDALRSLL